MTPSRDVPAPTRPPLSSFCVIYENKQKSVFSLPSSVWPCLASLITAVLFPRTTRSELASANGYIMGLKGLLFFPPHMKPFIELSPHPQLRSLTDSACVTSGSSCVANISFPNAESLLSQAQNYAQSYAIRVVFK